MHIKCFITVLALSVGLCLPAGDATAKDKLPPLMIQEQGSFAAGGKVITTPGMFAPRTPTNPAGQTLHGDHAYVFYQIPVDAHKLPLVFLHGAGQFSKTWESTPDGREGFQNIFLRRRIWSLFGRPASTWRCRAQHAGNNRLGGNSRSALVRQLRAWGTGPTFQQAYSSRVMRNL